MTSAGENELSSGGRLSVFPNGSLVSGSITHYDHHDDWDDAILLGVNVCEQRGCRWIHLHSHQQVDLLYPGDANVDFNQFEFYDILSTEEGSLLPGLPV